VRIQCFGNEEYEQSTLPSQDSSSARKEEINQYETQKLTKFAAISTRTEELVNKNQNPFSNP
jgi:hypothetical protein